MLGPLTAATAIFNRDITAERWRQLKKWGQQDSPDGTGWNLDVVLALQCKRECDVAFAEGRGTWRHILLEEVHEAFAETETAKLRKELIEVATVAIAWVEALDNRAGDREPRVPLAPVLADSATLSRGEIMDEFAKASEQFDQLPRSSRPIVTPARV